MGLAAARVPWLADKPYPKAWERLAVRQEIEDLEKIRIEDLLQA